MTKMLLPLSHLQHSQTYCHRPPPASTASRHYSLPPASAHRRFPLSSLALSSALPTANFHLSLSLLFFLFTTPPRPSASKV
ncbi:hypothetical protein Scep_024268 [Stephania cephalantha]|uniref:Uncharacterized protein n=1 Tax=Stephania cephalantha TaxID=152367 RepID=A0AAP0F3D4_9MAGN